MNLNSLWLLFLPRYIFVFPLKYHRARLGLIKFSWAYSKSGDNIRGHVLYNCFIPYVIDHNALNLIVNWLIEGFSGKWETTIKCRV